MTAAAEALLKQDPSMTAAEFVAACETFLATWKTMPKPLSDRRKARLREIRTAAQGEGRMVRWIAEHWGFNPNRFSKLTAAPTEEVAA
jgi:hypothetical protein